jgi:magnesium chelatase family protein
LCALDRPAEELLKKSISRLNLSARAYRVLKVACSIADLKQNDSIAPAHVAEAVQYRRLDRVSSRVAHFQRARAWP